MSDLYIEARLQAIKDIASASCTDEKDADNIASFCDEIYSAIPKLDKIIKIVKQGGDAIDVCEWKIKIFDRPRSFPIYNTSCGKIRLQCRPGIDIYCNGCGKKIKVKAVE